MTLPETGLLMLLLSPAFAQSGAPSQPAMVSLPGSSEPLTLDQALAYAETYSPQLRVAGAQSQGAQAAITTARAFPNPEVGSIIGRQGALQTSAVGGPISNFGFTQLLETPSVRRPRIQASQYGLAGSRFALDQARLAVRATVKQAFYQVLRHRGEIEQTRESLRLVEDLRRRVEVQVQVGEAARLELVRAEAEVATARTLTRSAELRSVTAAAVLRSLMGAPPDTRLDPQGTLDPPVPLPSLAELREEVRTRYPLIAQSQAEVRRAESLLQTERALRVPQPFLRGEYERQPDLSFFRFGVSLPLPVWNRREGPIAEATAALSQAEENLKLRQIELNASLEQAYGLYQIADQQVSSLESGALRQAEAALTAAEAAFRFGERGIIEVLDAQRVLRNTRLDHLNAQFDRQAALIELERLRALDPGRTP